MANYDSSLTGAQIEAALEAVNGLIVPSNNGKILTVENGSLAAKTAIEIQGGTIDALSVTENGTYTHAANGGYSPVTVNVQPELQTLTATENGTYIPSSGVDGYDEVVVNVSGGSTITPLTVTENGTYTAQGGGYSPVTVNIEHGISPMTPTSANFTGGYVSNGTYYRDGSTDKPHDSFAVLSGKTYLISKGDYASGRFRVMFSTLNPATESSNVSGSSVFTSDNSNLYESKIYKPSSDGYITIYKGWSTSIVCYVYDMEDLIEANK